MVEVGTKYTLPSIQSDFLRYVFMLGCLLMFLKINGMNYDRKVVDYMRETRRTELHEERPAMKFQKPVFIHHNIVSFFRQS